MKKVDAAIITIGDELLIGQTVDTNSAYIAQQLNKIGIWVKRRIAVGDVKEEILEALQQQSVDCAVIIITGGLGPTADDITKPTLCAYFDAQLIVNAEALQNVKDIFKKLNRPIIERNLRQAEVPHNCVVLPNLRGTAPGMWFNPTPGLVVVSLPGVPHEMKGLMTDSVIPRLKETFALPAVAHKTLLTAGIGESALADAIADFESNLPPHIKLAYLPAANTVRLRLTAKGDDAEKLQKEIDRLFFELETLVTPWMVADADIALGDALIQRLKSTNNTLCTAESCTGGYIAHLLTRSAGASAVYQGSVVAYANTVKQGLLFVNSNTLQQHGAVSRQTALEMLEGALKNTGADYGIATTGIMGPGGGSNEKPVGTIWIAVGNEQKQTAMQHFLRFDRERNIELAAHIAITRLFQFVKEQECE